MNTLPHNRWVFLRISFALLISVYYYDYSIEFSEGSTSDNGPLLLALKIIPVALIYLSLSPRFRFCPSLALIMIYALFATSYLLGGIVAYEFNDKLFLNTLIQIPVLIALSMSSWKIDLPKLLQFIGSILAIQICIDTLILWNGSSIWMSNAYVGGVGNPSSFGLECCLFMAFYLLHPSRGKLSYVMAAVVMFGAVMTSSLFAALTAASLFIIWMAVSGI